MLVITIHVNRPGHMALAIKEQIAMDLEKYGDVKVVSIKEDAPVRAEQMDIFRNKR